MIQGGRGGVCSEINTLYNWLLEPLGFEVVSYSSRIIAKTLPIQPQSHRVMGVKLDGRIYLTDAGFNYDMHQIAPAPSRKTWSSRMENASTSWSAMNSGAG